MFSFTKLTPIMHLGEIYQSHTVEYVFDLYILCLCDFGHSGCIEVVGWTVIGRSGFNSQHILTACGPSDGKEVKDVFELSGASVGIGLVRYRPPTTHGVGCPAAGLNLQTRQLSRHYITEILLNVTLHHNQATLVGKKLLSIFEFLDVVKK